MIDGLTDRLTGQSLRAPGLRLLMPLLLLACAPLAARPAAAPSQRDALMALVPNPVQSLLAVDVARLRGSPWAKEVLASAAPGSGRQGRGFDEIADVDRWLFATVRAPGSGTGTLELGRGRFDPGRVQAAFRERYPSAQERSFGAGSGLADVEAALTFPSAGTVALGPIWAVQAAVRTGQPDPSGPAREPWLAEAAAVVEEEAGRSQTPGPRPAVELWLRLDDRTRADLTAIIGDATAVDWIAARLTLGAEARVVAVAHARAQRDAAGLAFQLEQQIAALSARRSVRALGLGPVVERARVEARGPRVVLHLAVSEEERATVSQRLAALAEALRARSAPGTPNGLKTP
jgi:hypothetical protein